MEHGHDQTRERRVSNRRYEMDEYINGIQISLESLIWDKRMVDEGNHQKVLESEDSGKPE